MESNQLHSSPCSGWWRVRATEMIRWSSNTPSYGCRHRLFPAHSMGLLESYREQSLRFDRRPRMFLLCRSFEFQRRLYSRRPSRIDFDTSPQRRCSFFAKCDLQVCPKRMFGLDGRYIDRIPSWINQRMTACLSIWNCRISTCSHLGRLDRTTNVLDYD